MVTTGNELTDNTQALIRGGVHGFRCPPAMLLLATLLLLSCSGSHQNSDKITLPRLLESGNLRYPMSAQLNGQEGLVRLRLFVNEEGAVTRANIMESSGFALLDDAAMQYASRLLFEPAYRNGRAEPALIAWTVRFELTDMSREGSTFVTRVRDLYVRSVGGPELRRAAAEEILITYEDFAQSSTDAVALNEYIRLVIMPETYMDYAQIWQDCPLRLALFDDYLRRFGPGNERALRLLRRFAIEDIKYASEMCFTGATADSSGAAWGSVVRQVITDRYADLHFQ